MSKEDIINSINNVSKFRNTPDDILFCGDVYDYDSGGYLENYVTVPFIALNILDKKIYYGDEFECHCDFSNNILKRIFSEYSLNEFNEMYPEFDIINKFEFFCRKYKYTPDVDILDNKKEFNDFIWLMDSNGEDMFYNLFKTIPGKQTMIGVNGRLFEIETEFGLFAILSFWSLDSKYCGIERAKEITGEVCGSTDKYAGIYITNGTEKMIEYKAFINNDEISGEDLQLMNTDDDMFNHLDDARKKRLKTMNMATLGNMNWGSEKDNGIGDMIPAQYHALKYVDENKKRKKVFLTEKQIKYIKNRQK